jgi:hypothetical protein
MTMELKPREMTANRTFDQQRLKTKSFGHQFVKLKGQAVKRYIKNTVSIVSAKREDFWNSKDARDGMLEVFLKTDTSQWIGYTDLPMRYEDNVIELYSEDDVESFEDMNRSLIDSGTLIEYIDGLDYVYRIEIQYNSDGDPASIKRFTLVERPLPFDHNLRKSTLR